MVETVADDNGLEDMMEEAPTDKKNLRRAVIGTMSAIFLAGGGFWLYQTVDIKTRTEEMLYREQSVQDIIASCEGQYAHYPLMERMSRTVRCLDREAEGKYQRGLPEEACGLYAAAGDRISGDRFLTSNLRDGHGEAGKLLGCDAQTRDPSR